MKKNGFVFVETIVAIVILTSSLLLLYTSFSSVLQGEKTRVYYDDVSYIYRTEYIKERLDTVNLMAPLRDITGRNDKYFIAIGVEYQNLFNNHENERMYISNLLNTFDVKQMIIVRENKMDELRTCTEECALDKDCKEYTNCNNLYMNLDDEFISYLKSVYVDVTTTYVLLVEYNTCNDNNTGCHNYYGWVSV